VSYYPYLGAQLPYLAYGQNPPMSSGTFKALASELMSPKDAALLNYCTLDPDPVKEEDTGASYAEPARLVSSKMINGWKDWERTLRLNLAKNRAVKLKRDAGAAVEPPAVPLDAVMAAKNAMSFESPLEAELFLGKARWDAIESFQGINIFNESAMYAYY